MSVSSSEEKGERMINLDLATVRTLAREQVVLMGEDYVYPYYTCQNATDGGIVGHLNMEDYTEFTEPTALCIVGRILEKAGVPMDILVNTIGPAYTTIDRLKHLDVLRATPAAIEYLQALQSFQDNRETWGTSLKFANLLRPVGLDRF